MMGLSSANEESPRRSPVTAELAEEAEDAESVLRAPRMVVELPLALAGDEGNPWSCFAWTAVRQEEKEAMVGWVGMELPWIEGWARGEDVGCGSCGKVGESRPGGVQEGGVCEGGCRGVAPAQGE